MASLTTRASRIKNPVLFICDIQEKFRDHIYEFPKVVSTSQKLLKASGALQIPVYVTTQNRARLGDTVSELLPYLKSTASDSTATASSDPFVIANVDKTAFSMYSPEIISSLQSRISSNDKVDAKLDVIIVGIETHICVTQTSLDLLAAGHRVYVIADGVSSMNGEERAVALGRLRDAGAIVTTSESIIFEVLKDAKAPAFKAISGLVKETKEDTKDAVRVLCKY